MSQARCHQSAAALGRATDAFLSSPRPRPHTPPPRPARHGRGATPSITPPSSTKGGRERPRRALPSLIHPIAPTHRHPQPPPLRDAFVRYLASRSDFPPPQADHAHLPCSRDPWPPPVPTPHPTRATPSPLNSSTPDPRPSPNSELIVRALQNATTNSTLGAPPCIERRAVSACVSVSSAGWRCERSPAADLIRMWSGLPCTSWNVPARAVDGQVRDGAETELLARNGSLGTT